MNSLAIIDYGMGNLQSIINAVEYLGGFNPVITSDQEVIKDANGNGKWDTGNYLKKIQPEEVEYLKESINVRANWEFNEIIEI